MRRSLKFIRSSAIFAACLSLLVSCGGDVSGNAEPAESEMPPIGFRTDLYDVDSLWVKEGETFSGLFNRMGLDNAAAYRMAAACRDSFDVRKVRAGQLVEAYYSRDSLPGKLQYVVYHNDRIRSTVFACADSMYVRTYDKPVTVERCNADITIRTSLWNDMLEAGVSPLLILDLSEVYAWTVNFFGLQEGDRFRAIYNQRVCDGEVIDIRDIEFAIYDSGDFHAPAIRFDQNDGGNKYWNEKGESMRKAFLKAPLKFNRISSRFTYHRKHPVTGKVRAHTAVDYAAASGTPVHSIGDGTVTMCGWDSHGGGNRVRIRHMNGYETCYMHLRGFAKGIRGGVKVAQGQTIGYVGSTGTSTGPHLDFRVWKDGTPVNPLKMISPPSLPLNKENMDSLGVLYRRYMEELSEAAIR